MKNHKIVFTKALKAELVEDSFDAKDLKPTEIAIKTEFSLISAGTELACYTGSAPWFVYPGGVGYLNLGEVIEVGCDVKSFSKGDIIFSAGKHAKFHKFDTLNLNDRCMKLPEGVPHDQACFAGMGAISLTALRASKIELGDFVGVSGQGIIGNLAAQMAQLQGGTVIAMDISGKRLEIAKACGIEYAETMASHDALVKRVKAITGGLGVSTLIEATGFSEVVPALLPVVSKYGEVILLGTPRVPFQSNLTEVLLSVHDHCSSITFKGAHTRSLPFQQDPYVKHSHMRNIRVVFDAIKNGTLNVKPMLTHVMKPADCDKAYSGLKDKKDEYIAVLFDWR